jgi:hypothetical protein
VDFVPARGAERIVIEVKSGRQFHEKWCCGLQAIAPLDGLVRRIIVCPKGPTLRTEDGIDMVPFRQFSELLSRGAIWSSGVD